MTTYRYGTGNVLAPRRYALVRSATISGLRYLPCTALRGRLMMERLRGC